MVDKIDVQDLPEDQVELVQEFVEFLREKFRTKQIKEEDKGWSELAISSFAKDWENEKDAIYDNWEEIYGVSKG